MAFTKDTASESGRRGGNATKKVYGKDGYQQVGKLGGYATLDKYGKEHYSKIGKLGKKNRSNKKEGEVIE